jgi:hypothetical protein
MLSKETDAVSCLLSVLSFRPDRIGATLPVKTGLLMRLPVLSITIIITCLFTI